MAIRIAILSFLELYEAPRFRHVGPLTAETDAHPHICSVAGTSAHADALRAWAGCARTIARTNTRTCNSRIRRNESSRWTQPN